MDQHSNEAEIRALVERWASAVRAQDMDGALAHHARDIVMFDVPEPLQWLGIDEYRKTWELFFASRRSGHRTADHGRRRRGLVSRHPARARVARASHHGFAP